MIYDVLFDEFKLECGVPQGFSLSAILFRLYTSKLFEIVKFIVTKTYIYFSRNLKSDLLSEKAWKIAYQIFVCGC